MKPSLTFKRTAKASERSTNMRALSTRIHNIERQTAPTITIGGTPSGSPKVRIDRKGIVPLTMSSNAFTVKGSDLSSVLPDGGRILKLRLVNRTGRKVAVEIPGTSELIPMVSTNSQPIPNAISREAWQPLSRFPSLSIDIPDSTSRPIDTTSSTASTLFIVRTDGATDAVSVYVTYTTWA